VLLIVSVRFCNMQHHAGSRQAACCLPFWCPACPKVCLACPHVCPAAKFVVEGVDMLLLNDEGKISTLVQFDMQVSGQLATCSALLSTDLCIMMPHHLLEQHAASA
jgi:hypothetical protein